MYALLAIDSTLRIAFAMAVLFVLVPRLCGARPAPRASRLDSFWFNLGWGIVILTIAGQLLTLMKLYALPTLLLLCGFVILIARSVQQRRSPLALLRDAHRWVTLAIINLLERRVSIRRRVRRLWRRTSFRIDAVTAGWIALAAVAAAFRLYRPFATANLGFSDSYVHLYLVKLLDEGRQVDPAWGPYPRGMHFLLLAIQRLTNIDEILLVNFFGAFAGVLLVLAVAWTARRLSGSNAAAFVTGLIFATMVGGPRQYFILGGSFESLDTSWSRAMTQQPYANVPATIGEFDVLLTAFQRQSSTLSQELAIVLLFPAMAFLLEWLLGCKVAGLLSGRPPATSSNPATQQPLLGFIGCTAAIAATHSGVLVPLVLLCAIVAVVTLVTHIATIRDVTRGALAGLGAIVLGSTWLIGFIAYPFVAPGTHPGSTALYYFPFLRHFAADAAGGTSIQEIEAFNTITPFLIVLAIVALVLIVRGGIGGAIAGGMYLVFLLIHVSHRLGVPQIVESRRNSEWFLMAIAVLIGIASTRKTAIAAAVAAAWLVFVPLPTSLRDRLLNYSGYGSASLAVVEIAHKYEPFTWTLVSYGQEYPMVLGRGFHITASEFLNRYDPAQPDLEIPTRYVFVLTERTPHRFEVQDWRSRFSRRDIEQRLETWCQLYRATHGGVRIFLDDGNVEVFEIVHAPMKEARVR